MLHNMQVSSCEIMILIKLISEGREWGMTMIFQLIWGHELSATLQLGNPLKWLPTLEHPSAKYQNI